jgi:hypothetical protein
MPVRQKLCIENPKSDAAIHATYKGQEGGEGTRQNAAPGGIMYPIIRSSYSGHTLIRPL